MEVKTINASLLKFVSDTKGAPFAHLMYEKLEKLPKYLGIEGVVTKVAEGICQLNFEYEKAVNEHLKKHGLEPNFKSKALPWGKWFVNNLIIEHKGEYYLRYYLLKNNKFKETYYINGRLATEEESAKIKEHNSKGYSDSKTQNEKGLVYDQVTPRTVKFSNIISLKCGETYNRNENVEVAIAK